MLVLKFEISFAHRSGKLYTCESISVNELDIA